MSKTKTISPEKVREHDNPVLFTSKGGGVWHIPSISDGSVTYLCGRHSRSGRVHVSEYEFFLRRRNPRLCKSCKKKAQQMEVQAND